MSRINNMDGKYAKRKRRIGRQRQIIRRNFTKLTSSNEKTAVKTIKQIRNGKGKERK